MATSFSFLFPFNPRPMFKSIGGKLHVNDHKSVEAVKQAIREQWTDEPMDGDIGMEVEVCVAPPKRTAKNVREAMLDGRIAPSLPHKGEAYLAKIVKSVVGVVVKDQRDLKRMSIVCRYAEKSGGTARIGRVQIVTF